MQKPVPRTFIVDQIIGEGTSLRGDSFIEAKTSIGIVAFWGGAHNSANLRTIQSTKPRFEVTCGCIQPSAGYAMQHSFWVPEKPAISAPNPIREAPSDVVRTLPDLTRWRHAPILAAKFSRWLDLFDKNGPFRKPDQLLWHRKTIERRRVVGSGAAAVRDEAFLRSLYATLQAWGIGARESRLRPYEAFADDLGRHQQAIAALEGGAIDDEELDVLKTRGRLWALLDSLMIVENKAKLVSGTKTLHHVLPDLVVPMDRKYTQAFFGWQNPQFQYGQHECFVEAFDAFVHIARIVKPARFIGPDWRSSRTKLIDNGVVAVVQSFGADSGAD